MNFRTILNHTHASFISFFFQIRLKHSKSRVKSKINGPNNFGKLHFHLCERFTSRTTQKKLRVWGKTGNTKVAVAMNEKRKRNK